MRKLCQAVVVALLAVGLLASQSFGIIVPPEEWPDIIRTSEVSTTVTDQGGDVYKYDYTVTNTSPGPQWVWGEIPVWPLIVDYEVPLNDPGDVWDVQSPDVWDYEFISHVDYASRYGEPNPFLSPWVLHWYDTNPPDGPVPEKAIAPDGYTAWYNGDPPWDVYEPSASGFSFLSLLSPEDGPYLTSWVDDFRNIGDPPLPGGGGPIGGPPWTPIPEPTTVALLGIGVVALIGRCRQRKKS